MRRFEFEHAIRPPCSFGQLGTDGGVKCLAADDHQLACPENTGGGSNRVLELGTLQGFALSDAAKRL